MSTAISWTHETWNPVVGCTPVSAGCDNCYADTLHTMRHEAHLRGKKMLPQYHVPFGVVQLMPERLSQPLRWRAPRRIFVNSVSDLFHKDVPVEFLDKCFAVMAFARRHTFQILTKRPHRMRSYMKAWLDVDINDTLKDRWDAARWWLIDQVKPSSREYVGVIMAHQTPAKLPNVWLGTSVEHQAAAHKRIPELLDTPAAVRFLSCEPLLGPLDLDQWLGGGRLHWVIVGGESGTPRRDVDLSWIREIVQSTLLAGIATFVKQDSGAKSEQRGRIPDDLWIREYPAA